MATRQQTWENVRQFHNDVVELDGYISINASAAVVAAATAAVSGMAGRKEPTAGTSWSDGGTVSKVAATTGQYALTLTGKYVRMLSCTPVLCLNASATKDMEVILLADTVTPSTALGSQTVKFLIRKTSDGSAVDPTSACGIRYHLRLKNS